MWRLVVLSLVLACSAEKAPCKICPGSGSTRDNFYLDVGADHQDKHIMQMEKRLKQLRERYDGLDNISNIEPLSDRVDHLTGNGCGEKEFQCGGNHPKCISSLLVCDGKNDCDNESDEKQLCQNPGEVGTSWGGVVTWVGCGQRGAGHVYIVITDIDRPHYLPSVSNIQAQVIYEGNHEIKVLSASGIYCYASHSIILNQDDGSLHLRCDMDRGNVHCSGKLTRGNIDELCADINLIHH